MAATRVYILAKELGVKSSAIVKKCQAEGLDVKNHMSVISAGLAATIHEWFSEGENITTVETAKKVDLKKVKIRKKVKRKPPAKKAKAKKAKAKEPKVEEAEQVKPPPEVTAVTIEEAKPELEPEPEPEPEPVLPAGPILEKPEPAQLSGPQIVRVEEPEPIRVPRPKPRYDEPVTEPLMYVEADEEESPSVAGGDRKRPSKRPKDRTHGRRHQGLDTATARKPKVSKWRQRDIEERRARLDAAGGEGLRLRPTRKIATRSRAGALAHARPKKAFVSEPISVKDLSAALAVKSADIIGKLLEQGTMASANQNISGDVAELVALEFDT
ncbi:MAG: translation initiation factor IF-2 N-terminal domain-containing protein, partial [Planctomycetota bacterium]